jgi:formate dehydrogenase maturation protein FdhE
MDEFDCPACGSDDVRGERQPAGTITLTCQSCQTSWARVPKPSCPRCGKSDVEQYGRDDGVDDDPAAASANTRASGHGLRGRTFRCRKCHHTWGQAR